MHKLSRQTVLKGSVLQDPLCRKSRKRIYRYDSGEWYAEFQVSIVFRLFRRSDTNRILANNYRNPCRLGASRGFEKCEIHAQNRIYMIELFYFNQDFRYRYLKQIRSKFTEKSCRFILFNDSPCFPESTTPRTKFEKNIWYPKMAKNDGKFSQRMQRAPKNFSRSLMLIWHLLSRIQCMGVSDF